MLLFTVWAQCINAKHQKHRFRVAGVKVKGKDAAHRHKGKAGSPQTLQSTPPCTVTQAQVGVACTERQTAGAQVSTHKTQKYNSWAFVCGSWHCSIRVIRYRMPAAIILYYVARTEQEDDWRSWVVLIYVCLCIPCTEDQDKVHVDHELKQLPFGINSAEL